jgi:uncharacterized membrane protein YfcA
MFFPSSGVDLNPLLLIGIGLAVGVCSGFFGFGGGFITTPALNIFGFPMPFAIGTDMTQMAGSSFMSTMRHRKLGHVDFRLAICMIAGTMSGVELGKRLVMYLEGVGNVDLVIRWIYVAVLLALGLYMFNEARKAAVKTSDNLLGTKKQSDVKLNGLAAMIRSLKLPPMISFPVSGITRMSIWVPIFVGFITGLMAGLLGVGGGFIRMPTLVYLMGVPTVVAVGTDLFEVIISGTYGALTYAFAQRVELLAAFLILVGASAGVQVGAAATCYVSADRIRYCFAITILLAGISVLLKQISAIYSIGVLSSVSSFVLLGVAGGMSLLITILFLKNRGTSLEKRRVEEMERQLLIGKQPEEKTI